MQNVKEVLRTKNIDVERQLAAFYSEEVVENIIAEGRGRKPCYPMICKYDELRDCTPMDEREIHGKLLFCYFFRYGRAQGDIES